MAVGLYPPTVTINGRPWSESSVVDDLTVTWGRENIYDLNDPGILDVSLIVADTTTATPQLIGTPIVVETALGVLFRGRISGFDVSPLPGDLWRIDITATDPLADLSRDRIIYLDINGAVIDFQAAVAIYSRLRSIERGGAIARPGVGAGVYVSSIEGAGDNSGVWATQTYAKLHPAGEPTSWHELIAMSYRNVYPLAVVNYLPETDGIVPGRPAPGPSAVELNWTGALIVMTAVGANVRSIDAGTLEYDQYPPQLASTVPDSISSVRVTYFNADVLVDNNNQAYLSFKSSQTTAATTSSGRGARVLEVATDEYMTFDANGNQNHPLYAATIAAAWVTLVNRINDKLRHPELTYDFERFPPAPDLAAFLLRPYCQGIGLVFPGSELRALGDVPLATQLIGGRISWASGWRVGMILAPAAATELPAGVSIAELVPASINDPEFQDYAPDISIADLGIVTRGVV